MLAGKSQKELLKLARLIVQPLQLNFHKGQAGKVGIFGGCEDYTGAPFFASHSAALVGADLSHVICEKLAAPVIKGYSPDLMVHPYLYELLNPEVARFAPAETWAALLKKTPTEALKDELLGKIVDTHILPKVMALVDRIDVFVVGPGFGRDPLMLKTLQRILQEIMVANKPVVLDADSLFLILLDPLLIRGYKKAVITPNVVEFGRICSALGIENTDSVETAQKVSELLGGVVVVKKGAQEVIVRGQSCLLNDMEGSVRRVGGQGDTLTGAMATMLVWASHYQEGAWETPRYEHIENDDLALVACYAACALVRAASNKAFGRYKRSMQTSNIHEFLGEAYGELFEASGEQTIGKSQ
ncbi:hypothetical protein METBIDRAFT_76943 [Metschnikowia bicuspidata var. bicuspidata NRRL YB-4993]|uniref:ATP-dependent (S)-NAD(P)H-hydrate dehydratase n=1 Tax=Metschnikowia bicuspidata var. bicuspidata NRRL YB-4993 TaxID=869754 RepID=A0A1A0HIS5_9ASCO|nr:hypothetical protein METBIDRAFT_76943 [Metschnikowia bicuspidata var. bicuspidata NRRL YB-4993]OBA24059.1 hypothetical protein METBIDRAFT_76943 [Metschnikowia bicuspidata var. bicuspidata NRRL YB-4993]